MAGWTNKGKYLILGSYFRAETTPAAFYLALVSASPAPDADTNLLSDLTEVADGNGYAEGGESVARSAAGFDVWTENDTLDLALVQIVDVVWTAAGGSIGPARYAPLLDDNATPASRQVLAFFDLGADRTISTGQTLTIRDAELQLTE